MNWSWLWALPLLCLAAAAWKWQFWRWPRKGLLALMYHHIGQIDPKNAQFPFTVTPEQFERQLNCLYQHGFTPIHTADLELASCPARPVLLTFDDGHQDNFSRLFPILQARQIKALIFLVTDYIGTRNGYLTWEQVRQMHQSGLVEFGSHTCSHARLRSLSDTQIRHELQKSKQVIEEKLGVACTAFCYPFGSGGKDKRVRPLVFEAGYRYDFSTLPGINPLPWTGKKTLMRAFPRGGEGLTEFYLQITRGRSKF